MSNLPIVTICIISFNNQDTIEQCISSIEQQDYPHSKLIILDNNSQDHTTDFIKVNYLKLNEKKLLSAAKNFILTNQEVWNNSHIFAIVDPKTKLYPTFISKYVLKILEYPNEIGAVYSDYIQNGIPKYCKPYTQNLLKMVENTPMNFLLNKRAFEIIGGYKDTLPMYEDYDLLLRISQKFILTHIPEILWENLV